MFLPQEIIRKKRDNKVLTKEEIKWFIKNIISNNITDSQISAFTMAVYFNKLNTEELINLTLAMRDSGEVIKWSGLNKPIVDKHSTGGVGDLTSLIIAPMVAACDCYIPMIAGRGLGHTGGTLDKLDSIPGYNTTPNLNTFKKVVKEIGCAIIGQTSDLAPADRKIYSIRDITATTESLELIASSILSKKLSEGLDYLVMDIKTGNGAFLTKIEESIALAENIVNIGNGAGCQTVSIITDMSQPLVSSIGNALEVIEAIKYLQGDFSNIRLHEVVLTLSGTMLNLTNITSSLETANKKLIDVLKSGEALELFGKMIAALGGPIDFIDDYNKYLLTAQIIRPVYSLVEGIVTYIDTKKLGLTIVSLGGGRIRESDKIDYAVGLTEVVCIGDKITKDKPLAFIHACSEDSFNMAYESVVSAITIDTNSNKIEKLKMIYKYIH